MNIIAPLLTLGGLGVAFGLTLAYAAKKFHVPIDPKVQEVIAALPGANCGACGKAGCMGFAQALAQGELDLNSCTVCNSQARARIAKVLNLTVSEKTKQIAILHCQGGKQAKDQFLYLGMRDCIAANLVLGGQKRCSFGCLGFGTCAKACPFGAITMNAETDLPEVDESKCTACGNCVVVCPKHLFTLIPDKAKIYIACTSTDIGKTVMQTCGVGCIACRKCEKECPFQAITVIDNLARIDYEKCKNCKKCIKVCPTKVIKERST